MAFAHHNVGVIRSEAPAYAKRLSEALGFPVTVSVGKIKYTTASATVRIEVLAPQGNGGGGAAPRGLVPGELEADRVKFDRDCGQFGLTPADRLKTFAMPKGTFCLVTVESKNPKYPIIGVHTSTQKRYKFAPGVLGGLKAGAAAAADPPVPPGPASASESGSDSDVPLALRRPPAGKKQRCTSSD